MEETKEVSREESKRLHQESQVQYDKQQNALCFVVIGGILLIIGIIFIFLANKRENNQFVGIDTGSLAFYVMVIGISLGGLGVIYGIIKYLVASKKRRKIVKQINSLK